MVVLEWDGLASTQRENVRVLLRQTPAYGANGANLKGDAQCADYQIPGNREEVYVFINLVEAFLPVILNHNMRASSNS